MKRPMFRLGGGVIKGKQVGNRENFQDPTPTYDSLIKEILSDYGQSRQRAKDYGAGIKNILGAQVLASAPTLSSIRKLSDVPQVLSEIGSSPQLYNALLKSRSLDLKAQDKDLSSKMKMAALLKPNVKKSAMRDVINLSNELNRDIQKAKNEGRDTKFLEKQLSKVLSADSPVEERFKILQLLEDDERLSPSSIKKMYEILGLEKPEDLALGGRVGYQEGTPEPVMQQPMMQETMQPEAPKENTMSVKQMYDLMRQRIPVANVSDKDLYKIASSEQIMADFASLETMSDVTQFNEQYDTNIVLDLPIVG
jgi:hypothetical protein